MPKFLSTKEINLKCNNLTLAYLLPHDMILGSNTLNDLGMILNYY